MICFLCGEELDARKAFDVRQGQILRAAHPLCAVQYGHAEQCEVCKGVFNPVKLCSNERTKRKECATCYKIWQDGIGKFEKL